MRIWDLSGRLIAELRGRQAFWDASFSLDDQRIVSLDMDGTVREWRADHLSQLLSRGCRWLSDYLRNTPKLSENDRHLCDDVPIAQKPK